MRLYNEEFTIQQIIHKTHLVFVYLLNNIITTFNKDRGLAHATTHIDPSEVKLPLTQSQFFLQFRIKLAALCDWTVCAKKVKVQCCKYSEPTGFIKGGYDNIPICF